MAYVGSAAAKTVLAGVGSGSSANFTADPHVNSITLDVPLTSSSGGTGINNGTRTITIGGSVTFRGAFTFAGTLTGNTSVTFPTSGTLATTSQIPSLPLSLANGGTNANLTASNGGIFYSTATAGAILSGTSTARQMLQSGTSTTPAWSTTTWPATTTANRILYSSSTSVIGEITTAIDGVLITDHANGVPSILANGTAGYVLTANSGAPPSWQITQNAPFVGFVVQNNASLTNVTGDGTEYQVVFDAVVIDTASGYNNTTGVYTIPKAGKWLFTSQIATTGVTALDTSAYTIYRGAISAFGNQFNPGAIAAAGVCTFNSSVIENLSVNDVIHVHLSVSGSTKTVGVGNSNYQSFFTGTYLGA